MEEDLQLERQRWLFFAGRLELLRKVCTQFMDPNFGDHPNFDLAKRRSAGFAFGLMEMLSTAEISGTEGGSFRSIANLPYEAITVGQMPTQACLRSGPERVSIPVGTNDDQIEPQYVLNCDAGRC